MKTKPCLTLEDCRKMQGLDGPPLSPADLYDRINGGRDDGSLLEDAMHELLTRGVGTLATSGELWSRHMTRAGAAERALYGVTEAWLCPEFDHCMSAVIAGFRIVSGVPWYSNYTPDADGSFAIRRVPASEVIAATDDVLKLALAAS